MACMENKMDSRVHVDMAATFDFMRLVNISTNLHKELKIR